MWRRASWFLLFPMLAAFAAAQSYNPLPKLVVHAHYVLVTT
jgi:hypothetical protein